MISTGRRSAEGSVTGAVASVLRPGKGRIFAPSMVDRNDIFLASDRIQRVIVPKWALISREFTHTWKYPSNWRASPIRDGFGGIFSVSGAESPTPPPK